MQRRVRFAIVAARVASARGRSAGAPCAPPLARDFQSNHAVIDHALHCYWVLVASRGSGVISTGRLPAYVSGTPALISAATRCRAILSSGTHVLIHCRWLAVLSRASDCGCSTRSRRRFRSTTSCPRSRWSPSRHRRALRRTIPRLFCRRVLTSACATRSVARPGMGVSSSVAGVRGAWSLRRSTCLPLALGAPMAMPFPTATPSFCSWPSASSFVTLVGIVLQPCPWWFEKNFAPCVADAGRHEVSAEATSRDRLAARGARRALRSLDAIIEKRAACRTMSFKPVARAPARNPSSPLPQSLESGTDR